MSNFIDKKRIYIVFIIFLMIFILLFLRIVNYIYFNSKELESVAQNQYQYKEKKLELNYNLLDSEGRELLEYKDNYYAVIDPLAFQMNNNYTQKDDLEALKIILKGYNSEYDLEKLMSKGSNVKIQLPIDNNTYKKLDKINGVNGFYVYVYSSINRGNSWWSIENMITNIYKNENDKLKLKDDDSLEIKINDKTKKNSYTYSIFDKDVNGNIIKESLETPKNNVNVKLTIDKVLQDKIKNVLNNESYSMHEQIGVVLMEADTGKIKALVQKDDSKPNINIGASSQNGFFAGSIFKTIVEEAGIENGKLSLTKLYSYKNYSGLFEEHEDREEKNAKEAFIKSSNNVFVQIGEDVGIEDIDKLSQEHGLYDKVLGFDQEQEGKLELSLNDLKNNQGDRLQTYIGQKTRITPVQALTIPSIIVNKGKYVKPYIVESYIDSNNEILEKEKTIEKNVISERTAQIMKNQMLQVVNNEEGTGKQAFIKGIEIGGKTGTSKRVEINKNKENDILNTSEFYDGWFVGFFKVKNRYYSMVVFAQNIGKDINASGTAVPVFKDVVKEIYDYLIGNF
ncbi:stage V sporulation protein D [Clostridium homopropionicum DSM 5847]|uniref:Stage V sporulation protein D n=1 Tax=Clostridium homopropionicum DSM 5847 TaxID=1121318 RepID=A0A0L6ZC11_9CLOT|nr:penicillin-binding transpeptidase domain-containing protein [Clostridium homopropionicum]KOA20492.1 stage V sporulation protein D [Clostridium homopropionicum DSM 5847]SFG36662.1 Cell division protein FtsI/penicillin-binding protein 2 [Clostridium homopropionicum]